MGAAWMISCMSSYLAELFIALNGIQACEEGLFLENALNVWTFSSLVKGSKGRNPRNLRTSAKSAIKYRSGVDNSLRANSHR